MPRSCRATLLLLATLLFGVSRAEAQEVPPPPVVAEGFRLLVAAGVDTAVKVWFHGSALEGDTAATGGIVSAFQDLPPWLGRPIGSEILKTYALGTHLRRTYALLLHEGGPMYFRFSFYLAPKGWILQSVDFNTDVTKILPATLQLP